MRKLDWIGRTKAGLRRDEGFRAGAYRDTAGLLTIGYGRLIEAGSGLTVAEANYLLAGDVARIMADLDRALPWWRGLSEPRRGALVNMAYNLGMRELLRFRLTLQALEVGDWDAAAREMLASRWASQVGARAARLAEQVRTDRWA